MANVSELEQSELGYLYRDVTNDAGELLIRVEYFHEYAAEPAQVSTWLTYLKRITNLQTGEYNNWATLVVDSVTSMERTARVFGRKLNPKGDNRHWGGYRTDQLEQILSMSLVSLPINLVITCHQAEEKDELYGSFVRTMYAPARLGEKKGLATVYSEIYRLSISLDEKGDPIHLAQTKTDNLWAAACQIDAPNPCWPVYDELWVNFNGQSSDTFLHWILYGDFGSGKTHMAATFPKPMLVHCFDGFGKDMPYFKVEA